MQTNIHTWVVRVVLRKKRFKGLTINLSSVHGLDFRARVDSESAEWSVIKMSSPWRVPVNDVDELALSKKGEGRDVAEIVPK